MIISWALLLPFAIFSWGVIGMIRVYPLRHHPMIVEEHASYANLFFNQLSALFLPTAIAIAMMFDVPCYFPSIFMLIPCTTGIVFGGEGALIVALNVLRRNNPLYDYEGVAAKLNGKWNAPSKLYSLMLTGAVVAINAGYLSNKHPEAFFTSKIRDSACEAVMSDFWLYMLFALIPMGLVLTGSVMYTGEMPKYVIQACYVWQVVFAGNMLLLIPSIRALTGQYAMMFNFLITSAFCCWLWTYGTISRLSERDEFAHLDINSSVGGGPRSTPVAADDSDSSQTESLRRPQ